MATPAAADAVLVGRTDVSVDADASRDERGSAEDDPLILPSNSRAKRDRRDEDIITSQTKVLQRPPSKVSMENDAEVR